MLRTFFLVGASSLALICTSPVTAAVMTATFVGTIGSNFDLDQSYDKTGMFGGVIGGKLTALPFVVAFTYDTALGVRTTVAGISDEIYGSPNTNTALAMTATITINGITKHLSGSGDDFLSYAGFQPLAFEDRFFTRYQVFQSKTTGYHEDRFENAITISRFDTLIPKTLDHNVPSTLVNPSLISGQFYVSTGNLGFAEDTQARGDFLVTSYSVTGGVDAVPEPVSWALMVSGFGMTGFAMRRRMAAFT